MLLFCSTNFPVCGGPETAVFSENSYLTERTAVKIASVLFKKNVDKICVFLYNFCQLGRAVEKNAVRAVFRTPEW